MDQSPVKTIDNLIDNKKLDAPRRPGAEKRRSLRVQVEVNVPGRALRGRPRARIEYAPQAASDADESDPSSMG